MIDIKALLKLTIAFVVFTAIGTVSHEYGHIIVAKYFGYETTLHYGSMSYDRIAEVTYSDSFWITLGGPFQTILTGFVGLLIIYIRRIQIKEIGLKWVDWLAVFLSLFWLREVFNLLISLASELISPNGSYFGGDEVYISFGLDLWEGTVPIILGVIGIFVSAYVVFSIVPNRVRMTFILSGLLGGILGFILWMYILGPKLLP